jgi:hypothetical protein
MHVFGRPPTRLRYGAYIDTLSGGNHHPVLCELETEHGEPAGNWVVKPQISVTMGNRRTKLGILSELACADICSWVGIHTPEIGLMRFPDDLDKEELDSLPDQVQQSFRVNRSELAFCSRHLEGATDVDPASFRQSPYLLQALRRVGPLLLMLDIYLWHDDRTLPNPNALLWRYDIVAIDHGSAFATICEPREGKSLAGTTVVPPKRIKNHLLYAQLRRRRRESLDFDVFVRRIARLTDEKIDLVCGNWPAELDEPTVSSSTTRIELRAFLEARRSVVEALAAQVKSVVGV